jgi:hypothetical protein
MHRTATAVELVSVNWPAFKTGLNTIDNILCCAGGNSNVSNVINTCSWLLGEPWWLIISRQTGVDRETDWQMILSVVKCATQSVSSKTFDEGIRASVLL